MHTIMLEEISAKSSLVEVIFFDDIKYQDYKTSQPISCNQFHILISSSAGPKKREKNGTLLKGTRNRAVEGKRQKSLSKQEDKSLSQLSQQEAKEAELDVGGRILTRQDEVKKLLLNATLSINECEH